MRLRRVALSAVVLFLVCVVVLTVGWRATAFTARIHAYLFDHTAPVVTATGVDGGPWLVGGVTVTLTAADEEEGSGVASITYSLDGRTTTVAAAQTGVTLPSSPDATHMLVYHATDEAGNASGDTTRSMTVDTHGPSTVTRRDEGVLGTKLTLRCRVDDEVSPTATDVRIVVRNARGKIVARIAVDRVVTGTWRSVKWKPRTPGTFTWTVAANDLAGNTQAVAEPARLIVMWPVWKVIGRSVRGRSIQVARFGSGERRLLVVGGVHPMEAGTSAARQFAAYLTAHPEAVPRGWRIDVIPCLNPDGLARHSRGNARDVDLNRNFPSSSWRPSLSAGDPSRGCGLTGGASAGSEPEAKAFMSYLNEDFSTVLTLHGAAGILDCYGPGVKTLGGRLSALCGLPVGRLSYESLMTGTLEQYVAQRRRIPAIMFELTSPQLTPGLRRALLAAAS